MTIQDQIYRENEFITLRFAPCPNGPATLGHLKGLLLLDKVRNQSPHAHSTLHLRFDDNNPSELMLPEYYDSFVKIIADYDIRMDSTYYASRNLDRYEAAVKRLIHNNKAFFCSCSAAAAVEKIPECDCKANIQLQDTDLKDLGRCTIRFVSDRERSYVIYRTIVDKRTGHSHGSPTIALQGAVDDYVQAVSVILRGRDLESLTARQKELYRVLWDKQYPRTYYWGRIKVWNSGTRQQYELSKSKLKSTSENDLPNLQAFYVRGYEFAAVKEWLLSYGLTKHDMKIDVAKLNYYQKKRLSDLTEVESFSSDLATGYYKSHWCVNSNRRTERRNCYYWNQELNLLTEY